jgi:telomerase protein component 1
MKTTATWKTIRVFISSTFRDMQAERDHLVRFVFPKLRQELLQRRIHLVDVDLRWGVTSEQDALSVCREVVDECRPRFLCLLGGRYGWVPPGKTRSITADEVHYGVLDRDLKSRGFAFFYFRDPTATHAMVEAAPGEFREPAGSHGADALAELKTAIVEAGLQPFIYQAHWDDQSRQLIGLKEFGDRVYADLKQSIDQEFGLTTGEKLDEFTEENAAMEAFIEEHVQRFVLGSRQPVWNELRQHAECTGGNGYLCLTGEAGSGKSALLGKFCQDYRDAHPQDLVIPHFVGASPGSTDVRRTLRRLCHELVTGAELRAEIPEDPEKLRVAFPEILQQAAAQKRVVILLDAITQFDPNTQLGGWSWLPEELPANARIILSTLSGPALESLRQRSQSPRPVELQPLDAPDREAIIREFLHRYRKSLTDDQRAALLAKADAGTPLYLLVALEELRTLGTYEEITHRIAQLPPDTRALFIWILKRLEDDDGFRDASGRKIGRELVYRFVSLLGASRHGLSQQELVELLAPSDTQGNVAALAQLLRPYLMRRGELLDFYHGQFREAANLACLPNEASRQSAHGQLANFFRQQLDPDGQRTWTETCSRSLSELPHHLIFAARWDELERTLCDPGFLYAKCVHCSLYDVLRDLLTSQEFVPQNEPAYSSLGGVLPVLDRHSHLIQEHPPLIFQQMFNELVSFWDEDSTLGSILRARNEVMLKPGSKNGADRRGRKRHSNGCFPATGGMSWRCNIRWTAPSSSVEAREMKSTYGTPGRDNSYAQCGRGHP